MKLKKQFLTAAAIFSMLAFTLACASMAQAKSGGGNEYDKVVRHLKTKYRAKKIGIPFLWVAKLAVRVVRPAGVKSFSVTLFENLQIDSRDTLDAEMQAALRQSFSPEWSPVFRVRSQQGQQAYMYMREDGSNVKVVVVTIDQAQAAVIRAKFSPEKLAEFVNNPKIFGISLGDNDRREKTDDGDSTSKEISIFEEKNK